MSYNNKKEKMTYTQCKGLIEELGRFETSDENHYGLSIITVGDIEYAVGTEEESVEAAKKNIQDSLWAFNAEFIVENSPLPHEAIKMIQLFTSTECESANETIAALIYDIDDFAESAIQADGIGHFLSSCDGDMIGVGDLCVFRIS